jgi:hypothetical protein
MLSVMHDLGGTRRTSILNASAVLIGGTAADPVQWFFGRRCWSVDPRSWRPSAVTRLIYAR